MKKLMVVSLLCTALNVGAMDLNSALNNLTKSLNDLQKALVGDGTKKTKTVVYTLLDNIDPNALRTNVKKFAEQFAQAKGDYTLLPEENTGIVIKHKQVAQTQPEDSSGWVVRIVAPAEKFDKFIAALKNATPDSKGIVTIDLAPLEVFIRAYRKAGGNFRGELAKPGTFFESTAPQAKAIVDGWEEGKKSGGKTNGGKSQSGTQATDISKMTADQKADFFTVKNKDFLSLMDELEVVYNNAITGKLDSNGFTQKVNGIQDRFEQFKKFATDVMIPNKSVFESPYGQGKLVTFWIPQITTFTDKLNLLLEASQKNPMLKKDNFFGMNIAMTMAKMLQEMASYFGTYFTEFFGSPE